MNIIKYIFSISCILYTLASCYDDNENFSHMEISDIEILGVEESYRKYSMQDSLIIPITIRSGYDEEDLKYAWFIYKKNDKESVDTISREKDLKYPITEEPSEYSVAVKVQHAVNHYAVYAKTTLNVETAFSRGFYILKSTPEGNTDIDFRAEDGKPGYDLLSKSLGAPLNGYPQTLAQMINYPFVNKETNKRVYGYALGITTEKDLCLMEVKNMSLIHDRNTLFLGGENESRGKPGRFARGYLNEHYISADGCYSISAGKNLFGTNLSTGRFPQPDPTQGGSKWIAFHNAPYNWGFLYWDEINRRFLSLDFYGNVSTFAGDEAEYQPNNINGKVVFMGTTHFAEANDIYAVLQTPGNEKRSVYQLSYTRDDNPIKKVTIMEADSKFSQADHYAICVHSAPILYYIADNQLYYYSFVTETEAPITTLQGLPVGEKINYVSNRFWKALRDVSFDYLVVGTTAGNGNYTLSMYNMIGGQPNGNPVIQFRGVGKIADVQYVSPLFNEIWDWDSSGYGLSY